MYHVNSKKSTSASGNEEGKSDSSNKKKQLTPKEHLALLKTTGNQHFSKKKYDTAIDNYTRAIEFSQTLTQDGIKPEELAIFYQNRAACNEALGDFEKVIIDCDEAIKLKESYVKAYVRRAKAHEKLAKYDKALVDAISANLLEKFQNQANMLLTEDIVNKSSKLKAAEAMKSHKPTWPANQTIRSYFSAFTQDPIKQKLNEENLTTADQLQAIYDEAMKQENDNDPLSLLIRGSCQSLMGSMNTAKEAFDKLLELDDEICPPRVKANALIKKAAVVLSEPSGASPTIEKDLEHVSELLEQAIKIDPENPDIYLHKSQALCLGERLDEAISCLDKAIALKKDFHSAIAQKFYIEFKLATRDPSSKMIELLSEFENAVKENPEASDLHQMYAQVLTEMNYFEKADQVLLDLAKLNPNDGNIHVSRALLQFHMKDDPPEVARLMKEALKIDPKILFAYEILGSIENQRGNIDEAIKIFETALGHAQSEAEYARCYSLLDSAKSQKVAAEALRTQLLAS